MILNIDKMRQQNFNPTILFGRILASERVILYNQTFHRTLVDKLMRQLSCSYHLIKVSTFQIPEAIIQFERPCYKFHGFIVA